MPAGNAAAEHRNWGEIPRRTRRRDGEKPFREGRPARKRPALSHWQTACWEGEKVQTLFCCYNSGQDRVLRLSRKTCPEGRTKSHGFLAGCTGTHSCGSFFRGLVFLSSNSAAGVFSPAFLFGTTSLFFAPPIGRMDKSTGNVCCKTLQLRLFGNRDGGDYQD